MKPEEEQRKEVLMVGDQPHQPVFKSVVSHPGRFYRLTAYDRHTGFAFTPSRFTSLHNIGSQATASTMASEEQTIDQALMELSPFTRNDEHLETSAAVIQNLQVSVVDDDGDEVRRKRAYFLSSDALTFRHAGRNDTKPPLVFVRDLDRDSRKKDVMVYYTASGTGKSVELAGSSASRNAHLAMIVQVRDPSEDDMKAFKLQAEESWKEEERANAGRRSDGSMRRGFIRKHVKELVANHTIKKQLGHLVGAAESQLRKVLRAAVAHGTALKIILGIDEASSCLKLVREILLSSSHISGLVKEAFVESLSYQDEDVFKVQFVVKVSVAGTGVASAAAGCTSGSIPSEYRLLEPSFEFPAIRQRFLSQSLESVMLLPVFVDVFPVLAKLMENGSMASIAIAKIKHHHEQGKGPLREEVLVNEVIQGYVSSGALSLLMDNTSGIRTNHRMQKAAAAALAIQLFCYVEEFFIKVPRDVEKFAQEMKFFGLCESFKEVSVKELVTTYGLLQPTFPYETISHCDAGQIMPPPVELPGPLQLVAVHMLGIELQGTSQPDWIDFKTLSTHFVKCAIIASMAVPQEKRPSIAATLERLGFHVRSCSKNLEGIWARMGKQYAVSMEPKTENEFHNQTWHLRTALKLVANDKLSIERTARVAIVSIDEGNSGTNGSLCGPVAFINHCTSELPDGFVVFHAKEPRTVPQKSGPL